MTDTKSDLQAREHPLRVFARDQQEMAQQTIESTKGSSGLERSTGVLAAMISVAMRDLAVAIDKELAARHD